jgi:hypothetical protein
VKYGVCSASNEPIVLQLPQIADDRARHAMPRHGEKADLLAGLATRRAIPGRSTDTCGCRTAAMSITGRSPLIGLTLRDCANQCLNAAEHFEALRMPGTAWAALAASPGVTSLPNAP